MSFETFPCGSPEAESPEEPAPSLYVENSDEDPSRLLMKKPVDTEPSRLAETANIEDKIMNEDEIAQVNASGGEGLKINTPSDDARSKNNADDSARRVKEGHNMYDVARAHWIQLNYRNPATVPAHSLIPSERQQQQGELSLSSGKSFESGDRATVIIKRSNEQQEMESDSDNESQDASKINAKDSLRCNENISGVEANDENVLSHSRALYYNYNGHHEDVNKLQDKGNAKSAQSARGELLRGVHGEAKPVPIYYMPAGAYSHMVAMPGAAASGNSNVLQRDHFVHAGTNEVKRFPMQQHLDYVSGRPEQQVPVATSTSEGNVYGNLQHGSAGIQYMDRRLVHSGGYAVVPGIGPVRVIDRMYYQGLPMGGDQSHYENFASVQSFVPMGNIPADTTATQPQAQQTTSSTSNTDLANQRSQEKLLSMCQVHF